MPTLTFYASPTNDGYVENTGTDWNTVRNASAGTIDSSFNGIGGAGPLDAINSGTVTNDFGINRLFLSFDTSTIGSAYNIVSATLTVFLKGTGDMDATLNIFEGTQTLPITNGDYSLFNNTLLATPVNMSSIIGPPTGTDISLNAQGIAAINKTGTTKLCLRGGLDYNNTPPPLDTLPAWQFWGPTVALPTQGFVLTVVTSATNPPVPTLISPNTGPTAGGTNVTIGGTGFVSGCVVNIGGRACSNVVFVSSTQLTATTGNLVSVGVRNVNVTNPDGVVGTLTNGFTYFAVPPALLSVSPNSGPAAGFNSCTLTGTGFASGGSPPNSVTFGANTATFGAGQGVISDTTIVCTVPAGQSGTTVDVTVINPDSVGSSTDSNAYTYIASATQSGITGTQATYDFTQKVWYSGSMGKLTCLCTDPSNGIPKIYVLEDIIDPNTGQVVDAKLKTFFDEGFPQVPSVDHFPGLSQGLLQTYPIDFGNPTAKKQFQAIRIVLNDVTAIVADNVNTLSPWTVFAYVNNANALSPPIAVPLIVETTPFNVMPVGTIDADAGYNNPAILYNNNIGELIGFLTYPSGAPVVGNNIRFDIYFPTGTPKNTPASGLSGGFPLNLPWAIYKIDVIASLADESKAEP